MNAPGHNGPTAPRARWERRLWVVGGAAALAVAAVGYFTGTRPPPPRDVVPAVASAATDLEATRAVPRYADLRSTRRGPNAAIYEGAFEQLRGEPTALESQSPEDRALALEARRSRRAYDGAPPTIPHEIDQRQYPDCLACHEKGATIAGKRAPRMSHVRFDSCTQCHVVGTAPRPLPVGQLLTASEFAGLEAPAGGERAYPGAPPTIPHPTFMREQCSSCHGTGGLHGLRTSHPDRQSCTQCHAPSAVLDQRVRAESPPPWERK